MQYVHCRRFRMFVRETANCIEVSEITNPDYWYLKIMDPANFEKASYFSIKPPESQKEWPVRKRKIHDLLDNHDGALQVADWKIGGFETPPENASEGELKSLTNIGNIIGNHTALLSWQFSSAFTDEMYQKIMDSETAFRAWKALEVLFEETS